MSTSSDSTLALLASKGDQQAFAELYARYRRAVHAIALTRLPPQEAGDLVQDVFLRALARLSKLRKPDAFRSWLFMIARNRAMDLHRQRKPVSGDADLVAEEDAPRAEALQVLSKIRELPDAYQETLVMRLVSGMTGPEIAKQTGLKPESVRVNLHRGMKLLREKLGEEAAA